MRNVGRGAMLVALAAVVAGCAGEVDRPSSTASSAPATIATEDAEVVLSQDALVEEVHGLYLDVDDTTAIVTCDGDLPGVVGFTRTCDVVRDGSRTGVRVEVMGVAVAGETVEWTDQPFLHEADIEASLTQLLEEQGARVSAVDCPGDLPGEVDEEATCDVSGSVDQVVVRVSAVDGLAIEFEFTS